MQQPADLCCMACSARVLLQSPPPAPPPPAPAPPPPPPPTPPQPSAASLNTTPTLYSLVMRLDGAGLSPWTVPKAGQFLAALTAVLRAAGVSPLTANGAVLVSGRGAAAGARRRLAQWEAASGVTVAAASIPPLGTPTQEAVVQAVVTANCGSAAALQAALVGATASGQMAVQLRTQGEALLCMLSVARTRERCCMAGARRTCCCMLTHPPPPPLPGRPVCQPGHCAGCVRGRRQPALGPHPAHQRVPRPAGAASARSQPGDGREQRHAGV